MAGDWLEVAMVVARGKSYKVTKGISQGQKGPLLGSWMYSEVVNVTLEAGLRVQKLHP